MGRVTSVDGGNRHRLNPRLPSLNLSSPRLRTSNSYRPLTVSHLHDSHWIQPLINSLSCSAPLALPPFVLPSVVSPLTRSAPSLQQPILIPPLPTTLLSPQLLITSLQTSDMSSRAHLGSTKLANSPPTTSTWASITSSAAIPSQGPSSRCAYVHLSPSLISIPHPASPHRKCGTRRRSTLSS